jgi:uncharacterized membrane protein YczE
MRLLPLPADHLPARSALLLAGLALYGISIGMMLQAGLGQMPWSVLDQGLSRTFGLQVGTWSIITGAVVLLLWLPLRQRPGVGTLANIVLIGLAINATLAVLPPIETLAVAVPVLVAGVLLNGVATGAYIGAGMGPGPRDGLSTGLAAKGLSLRLVRTSIELAVLGAGWLLGGEVGVGTVLYAVAIGAITHVTIPALRVRAPAAT